MKKSSHNFRILSGIFLIVGLEVWAFELLPATGMIMTTIGAFGLLYYRKH